MSPPVHITFRGMSRSSAVEAAIEGWVQHLERAYDRIDRCDVWIELPHRHQRRGGMFAVRLVISVPGTEIVVSHDPGRRAAHDDLYLALADAFLAARRRLHDHARVRRGDVKAHAA